MRMNIRFISDILLALAVIGIALMRFLDHPMWLRIVTAIIGLVLLATVIYRIVKKDYLKGDAANVDDQ